MYKTEITHLKDLLFNARAAGDFEFPIDAKGKGLTPPDALLAGLGSCIGVYIRKYAEGSKLKLENFKISVKAEFAEDAPVRFKVIKLSIDLKGVLLDERRKGALLEFIKNCPVHNTLTSAPVVELKIL